jgi:hypothetical protein
MPSLKIPPDKHEFEISLFGPGVGECIVLHLGDGHWVIVDSCIDRTTGNPVALDYLEGMSVAPDRVKQIIVSHWHNDHCAGVSKLLQYYSTASLVLSVALRATEFRQLIAASRMEIGIGTDELRLALDVLRPSNRIGIQERRTFVLCGKVVFQSSHAQILCLSPSDRTIGRSFVEISSLIETGQQRKRAASHSSNDVAVTLWIQFGDGLAVLLGSDLEKTNDKERGWVAVVESKVRPKTKAKIFKVAHHGSDNADESRVWSEMLEQNAYAILTPYRLGVKPLPSESDRIRLCSQTAEVYATTHTHTAKPDLNKTVDRVARGVAKSLRRLDSRMGHIRLRRKASEIFIELFGPAHKISA